MIELQKSIEKKDEKVAIIKKIEKSLKPLKKKYEKMIEPEIYEEVHRRYSLIERPLFEQCLSVLDELFQLLNLTVSNGVFVNRLIRLAELQLVIVPNIGLTRCVSVRENLTDLMSKIINEIKRQLIQSHSNESQGKKKDEEKNDESDEKKKKEHTSDSTKTIGKLK